MANDSDFGSGPGEEIEAAPPAISMAELRQVRLTETHTVNRYLYQQAQQMVLMLIGAPGLPAYFELLLAALPRHFGFRVAELWLYDPDNVLDKALDFAERYGEQLQLLQDVFPLQELYDLEPDVALIEATDSRMFGILKGEQGIDYALLLPLMESGDLVGSLHLGVEADALDLKEPETGLMAHLATIISVTLKSLLNRQEDTALALLDALTKATNARGFARQLDTEIARAVRAKNAVTLLQIDIDEFDGFCDGYGERRAQFVIKKVAQRLSSSLRATDLLARLGPSRFAVLIPAGGELVGYEVAERMRNDIQGFAIDDGQGAVLQVCISIGLVTWVPQQFPAVDLVQLARQLQDTSNKALRGATARGGNCVVSGRLVTRLL